MIKIPIDLSKIATPIYGYNTCLPPLLGDLVTNLSDDYAEIIWFCQSHCRLSGDGHWRRNSSLLYRGNSDKISVLRYCSGNRPNARFAKVRPDLPSIPKICPGVDEQFWILPGCFLEGQSSWSALLVFELLHEMECLGPTVLVFTCLMVITPSVNFRVFRDFYDNHFWMGEKNVFFPPKYHVNSGELSWEWLVLETC